MLTELPTLKSINDLLEGSNTKPIIFGKKWKNKPTTSDRPTTQIYSIIVYVGNQIFFCNEFIELPNDTTKNDNLFKGLNPIETDSLDVFIDGKFMNLINCAKLYLN